jgi:copper chaperone
MIEFQIPNMTCGHCAARVTQAIRTVAPEARMEFDLAAHRVTLDADEARETLAEALTEAGYPPVTAA